MRWDLESPEVLYARPGCEFINARDVAELKRRAASSSQKRCRICLHDGPGAALHGMLIVHGRDTYVRPHRHLGRPEVLIAIEGSSTFVRFDAEGRPTDLVRFGAGGGDTVARVISVPIREWHGLIIDSEWLVFYESTLGPFDPSASEAAPWSCVAADQHGVDCYHSKMRALLSKD